MEEKLDKFLAYLEENVVEISGETAFKCDDGIVLFSPNEGGGPAAGKSAAGNASPLL